jgi:hypothetical protein
MTVIREGDLEFSFGAAWNVLKYDEDGSYYKTKIDKHLKPTKAIDFLCLRDGTPLVLVEVKDFSRGVPPRDKVDKIPVTVAIKVRDTLAGIIGGLHNADDHPERSMFQESYRKLSKPPTVVYFYEDLNTPARRLASRATNEKDTLRLELKVCLRWLTQNVIVVGLNDYRSVLSDLTIRRIEERKAGTTT